MSLETAADNLANRLRSMEYVEMYSHYDADGIAAAAILSIALSRADIAFKLRILPGIHADDVENPEISLLCDFGASCTDLADNTMIIDHHVPYNTSPYHVNPRLEGEDGETGLSAAGCAFIVANALGDNRDLAGLVMLGIIGDSQALIGRNAAIIGDAVENNLINPGHGTLLAGRTAKEQISAALHPYLPGLSGNDTAAAEIEAACTGKISDEAYTTSMLSRIIAETDAPYEALLKLYGESWHLEREVIHDAHAFTAVTDACGKSGKCDVAYALCCGDISYLEEAWDTAVAYRREVISAVRSAEQILDKPPVWRVNNMKAVSYASDILLESANCPVFVIGRRDDSLWISARAPGNSATDLETIMRSTADACGGTGGGHRTRAGGEIPADRETEFLKTLETAVCA